MNSFSLNMAKLGLLSFILAVSLSYSTRAQDKDWRPITPAELAAKTPIVEPDADAEAIFWEVRIDDSSSDDVSRKHYVRVKIFSERGREKFSKFDIPFTKRMKIKDLAARVIKADGSIVEINKNDIFEREIIRANGVKVKAKSFAIPNIEPGVIVEYRYKETTEDAGASGMRLQFQRDIPVQNLAYYYRPYRGEPRYQMYNFSGTKFNKDKDGYYLAQRTNVPALKSEPRMPPEDTVRPWMLLTGTGLGITSASPYSISFTIKDPSNQALYWGGVASEYAGVNKLMEKPSDDIKKATSQLLAGTTSATEKLIKIYEFCQKEIANTEFDPSITADQRSKLPEVKSANDAFKKKTGSAMFIDLLFGSMTTAAGFETRIALLGDRSEMLFNPKMTNDSFIRPGGIGVLVDNKWKVFNPGSKFAPYGMLPWYEEGGWAMLVGPKEYTWEQTPFTNHIRSNKKRTAKLNLLSDGTIEGDVVMEYTGHPALTYRLDNYDDAPATRESNLKNEITGQLSTAEVSNISIENLEDSSKPLIFRYKVRVPNYAQKTGKRLFLQPGYFESGKGALFAAADRKYDIVFSNPWSDTDNVEITWPEGYELDNADAPADQGDTQNISSLKTRVEVVKADRLMKYRREFYFGGGGNVLFDASIYPVLKKLFDEFHSANSHTITFKQL